MQKDKLPADSNETRERLLRAAGDIFADLGYEAATTRSICERAGANAAAVNYHFGDKLGLYTAVLERNIGSHTPDLQRTREMDPELGLREFVTQMSESLLGSESSDRQSRLMAHEMWHPSPALAKLVEQVMKPRMLLLCDLVARLIDRPTTALETRLAAQSIIAQIVHYLHSRPMIELLWPRWNLNAAARAEIVNHIVAFSLAGLRDSKMSRRGS